MKNILIGVLLSGLLLIFGQCNKNTSSDCVEGNGDYQIDTRYPSEFIGFTVSGNYIVNFSKDDNSRIDLFTDSNISPLVKTTVSDEILNVAVENDACYSTPNPIELTLTAPEIRYITMNGEGTLNGHEINQDFVNYKTSGSVALSTSIQVNSVELISEGTVDANIIGTAIDAIFNVQGTASILASALTVEDCFITISGSGDVRISVNGLLDVTITGAGNVYYTGDPETINTDISGTGQLIKIG